MITIADSASSQSDCSLPSPSTGDYCHVTHEVVFPVGVVTQEVTIQLIDDQIAEGEEAFYVQLVEGEGLTNAILHGNIRSKVIIEDTEDCELYANRRVLSDIQSLLMQTIVFSFWASPGEIESVYWRLQ